MIETTTASVPLNAHHGQAVPGISTNTLVSRKQPRFNFLGCFFHLFVEVLFFFFGFGNDATQFCSLEFQIISSTFQLFGQILQIKGTGIQLKFEFFDFFSAICISRD